MKTEEFSTIYVAVVLKYHDLNFSIYPNDTQNGAHVWILVFVGFFVLFSKKILLWFNQRKKIAWKLLLGFNVY